MDELDALGTFRQDAPAARPEAKAAAWARLQRTIERAASQPSQPSQRVRRPWLLKRLVPLTAAVLVAALVLVAGPLSGARDQPTSAAARELNALAQVAKKQPSDTALTGFLDGEYAYTKSEALWASATVNTNGEQIISAQVPVTREIWIGVDGSGRIRQTAGEPIPVAGASQEDVAQMAEHQTYDRTFGPGELSHPLEAWGFGADELIRLSDDPAALATALFARADNGKNQAEYQTFEVIGDMLRESVAPAKLRAALYQVAAGIPGVELLGDVVDQAGRPGVGVAMTHNGIRHELIFDPRTAALLGERDVLTEPLADWGDAPVGTVVGYTTYLASGTVTSTSATP